MSIDVNTNFTNDKPGDDYRPHASVSWRVEMLSGLQLM